MNVNNVSPMVELVGGPFCGAVVPWPNPHETLRTIRLVRTEADYELETATRAVCSGWLTKLRKQ
jgi:hypothetical protein